MKKLTTFFSIASSLILSMIFFARKVYANPIDPGQGNNNQNGLIVYEIVGGIIIIIIIAATIILNKLRKKNANK